MHDGQIVNQNGVEKVVVHCILFRRTAKLLTHLQRASIQGPQTAWKLLAPRIANPLPLDTPVTDRSELDSRRQCGGPWPSAKPIGVGRVEPRLQINK